MRDRHYGARRSPRYGSESGNRQPDHGREGRPGPVGKDLARLIRLLVDEPEDVVVGESRGGGETLFRVSVGPDDLGKVIGRQGRTARALRTLLEVRGAHEGHRYGLDIREAR